MATSEYRAGYYQRTKDAHIKRAREWSQANPERRREIGLKWSLLNGDRKRAAQTRYRKEKPLKYILNRARVRAKRKGLCFDITAKDLSMPTTCPLLGIPIDPFSEIVDLHPSLDRIDNRKGYEKGNVMIVSVRANRIKSDATHEELALMARNLRQIVGGAT